VKTLDAGQASLLAGVGLSLVTLAKLTTYSDRVGGTVQATRYFSDGARRYDWANTGTVQQFEPYLLRVENARDTMHHLPSASGGGFESALRRTRQITLRNWLPELGVYLFTSLRAENIEYARVEIAHVFVDRGTGASFNDLSALTGGEQTWLFRGVVASIGRVTEHEITLELEAELPQIPWLYADDASKNDLRDLGQRLPIVYGSAIRVPAIGWDVGAASTLAVAVDADDTTVEVTDSLRFPTSGTGQVGSESIIWTGKTGNQLTTVTRGANSTRAISHKIGEPVIETIATATWVVAGHAARAVNAVYARSPYNGAVVRVAPARYAVNTADAASVPAGTVTSVKVTAANLRGLIADLASAVTEQATGANEQSETRTPSIVPGGAVNSLRDGNPDSYFDGAGLREVLTFPAVADRTIIRVKYSLVATLDDTEAIHLYAASSGGSPLGSFSNDFGVTRTGVWELETTNATLMGVTIYMLIGAIRVFSVVRTEYFTSGPVRTFDERKPTAYAGSPASIYTHMTDGVTDAGDWTLTSATSADWTWDAIVGRTVLACIYRVYALIDNTEALGIAQGGTTTTVGGTENNSGATIEGWFEWYTEVAGAIGTTVRFQATGAVVIREVRRIEIFVSSSSEATIAAATVGAGLQLFSDMDGYNAPSAFYLAGSGNLMTEMPDVLRHLLTVLAVPAQTVDATWNDVGGASYLDDNAHAMDLRTLGESLLDVCAGLGFEGRCSLLADERTAATTYRLLAALATYAWPAAATTLTKWQAIEEEGRDAQEILTRTRYLYQWHPELGDSIDAFLAAVQTTVSAAETKYGRHDAPAVGLRTVQVAATAAEIAGYYSAELARVAALWRITGVPWIDGYTLERGDVVQFTPPWHGSARKGRVIEAMLRLDNLTDLRVVEVS